MFVKLQLASWAGGWVKGKRRRKPCLLYGWKLNSRAPAKPLVEISFANFLSTLPSRLPLEERLKIERL